MPRISPTKLGKKAYKNAFGTKNLAPRETSKETLRAGERFHQGDIKSWWYTFIWVISLGAMLFLVTLILLFRSQNVIAIGAVIFAIFLALFTYFLRLDIRTRKDVRKLLPGEVVFDGHGKNKNEYLRSKKYANLGGQPDYVYHLPKEDKYYVVDLKTCFKFPRRLSRIKDHVQLAAYYLMLEEKYGDKMLRHGYIIYQNRSNYKTKLVKVIFDDFAIKRVIEEIDQANFDMIYGDHRKTN